MDALHPQCDRQRDHGIGLLFDSRVDLSDILPIVTELLSLI